MGLAKRRCKKRDRKFSGLLNTYINPKNRESLQKYFWHDQSLIWGRMTNVSLTCLTGYQTSNRQNVWNGSLPSQHLPRFRRLPSGLFSTPPLLILHVPSSPLSPGSTDFKRAKDSVENRVPIIMITVMEIKTGKMSPKKSTVQEPLTKSKMLGAFGVSVPFYPFDLVEEIAGAKFTKNQERTVL